MNGLNLRVDSGPSAAGLDDYEDDGDDVEDHVDHREPQPEEKQVGLSLPVGLVEESFLSGLKSTARNSLTLDPRISGQISSGDTVDLISGTCCI